MSPDWKQAVIWGVYYAGWIWIGFKYAYPKYQKPGATQDKPPGNAKVSQMKKEIKKSGENAVQVVGRAASQLKDTASTAMEQTKVISKAADEKVGQEVQAIKKTVKDGVEQIEQNAIKVVDSVAAQVKDTAGTEVGSEVDNSVRGLTKRVASEVEETKEIAQTELGQTGRSVTETVATGLSNAIAVAEKVEEKFQKEMAKEQDAGQFAPIEMPMESKSGAITPGSPNVEKINQTVTEAVNVIQETTVKVASVASSTIGIVEKNVADRVNQAVSTVERDVDWLQRVVIDTVNYLWAPSSQNIQSEYGLAEWPHCIGVTEWPNAAQAK